MAVWLETLAERGACTQGELAATAVNAPVVPAEVLVQAAAA